MICLHLSVTIYLQLIETTYKRLPFETIISSCKTPHILQKYTVFFLSGQDYVLVQFVGITPVGQLLFQIIYKTFQEP